MIALILSALALFQGQTAPTRATMQVTPAENVSSTGSVGGPFTPASAPYSISNVGKDAMSWTVGVDVNWITLNVTSGTLGTNRSRQVLATIDSDANALAAGTYVGTLTFTNVTSGIGTTARQINLIVSGAPPILVPGAGWGGPTAEPGQVGVGTAKCIARWDCVPNQEVDGEIGVGIVAFHMDGISRVEVAVKGGPWAVVNSPSMNPTTGAHEYWVRLREDDFASTQSVELRAIAFPVSGFPRLLESLFLYVTPEDPARTIKWCSPTGNDTSGNGSESQPYRTMWRAARGVADSQGGIADAGLVYMKAGNYPFYHPSFGNINTVNSWVTFERAPGLAREEVVLTSAEYPGLDIKFVRLKGITINTVLSADDTSIDFIWTDNCHLRGNGQDTYISSTGKFFSDDWNKKYLTDCLISDNQKGSTSVDLVRNCQNIRIGELVFGTSPFVVNCIADDVNRRTQVSWHPDVIDTPAFSADNTIYYGVTVTNAQDAQGLSFGHATGVSHANMAFVNIVMQSGNSHAEVPLSHILIWNCTFPTAPFIWRTPQAGLTNISVRGDAFYGMAIDPNGVGGPGGDTIDEAWFDQNHFATPGSLTPGTNATTGDPMFGVAFSPLAGSPLLDRLNPLLVPIDAFGTIRTVPGSVGAVE